MKLICVVMKEEAPAQFTDTVELFNYGFSSFHMINVADADSRYTVGNELFFESDADVFGSSSPILSIDPSDSIVLPATAEYEDTQSVLSYHDPAKADALAEITFTFGGVYVGSAAVRTADSAADGASGAKDTDQASGRIYINVRLVLTCVIAAYFFLNFLVWLITLIRNYSFSSQRKDRRRRRRRHEKERIDYDRYIRKDPEGF